MASTDRQQGSVFDQLAAVFDSLRRSALSSPSSELLQDQLVRSFVNYALVTGCAYAAGRALEALSSLVYEACTVQLTIDSRDEAYRWFLDWLSSHPYTDAAGNVAVHSNNAFLCFGFRRDPSQEDGEDTPYSLLRSGDAVAGKQHRLQDVIHSDESIASTVTNPNQAPVSGNDVLQSRVLFTPGPGTHWLRYRGRWLKLERARDSVAAAQSSSIRETLSITMFFASRRLAEQLIRDVVGQSLRHDANRTIVYVPDQYGGWRRSGSRLIRPLRSVILRSGQAEQLLADIVSFGRSEQWYAERGIPWRRSFLLYGPPGNGKTSFIGALAGELGLNIYVVNLSSKFITDENLADLMSQTPKRCVLLLEDIDAAFVQGTGAGALTHSGLLNAIDGVGSIEGRLFFMTTNHIDALSEAFLRPGRVDVQCYFANASRHQVARLFLNFYPGVGQQQADQFADLVVPASDDSKRSMASVQALLMAHRHDPLAALVAAAQLSCQTSLLQ